MRFRLVSLSLLAIGLFLAALPLPHGLAEPPEDAPWKHLLTGKDAERVGELERAMRERFEAGRYAEAIQPARQSFEIRTRVQGPTHWQALSIKDSLQLITKVASLPKEAQEAITETGRLQREELPKLRRKAQYREAAKLAERIASIRTRYLGEDSMVVANALNDQAVNSFEAGEYTQAKSLYRRVIDITKKILGDQHPNTAAAYGNLGITLESLDEFAEAREVKEKALRIYLRSYGEQSESAAIAYHNLAGSDEKLGHYRDAEDGYRKALAIFESLNVKGIERRTATTLNSLGGVLNIQAKYADAERTFDRALAMKRALYGDDHPETGLVYNNWGVCLANQEKYAAAEPFYRRALEIYNRALGADHPYTLGTYNNLALVLLNRSKFVEAESLLRQALYLQSSRGGKPDHSTAIWLANLAHTLEAQDRPADAIKPMQEALAINRAIFKDEHSRTALASADLAVVLSAQEKYDEAGPLFRSASESLRKSLGEKHPLTARARANLGGNLYYQGDFSAAESIHRQVLATYQETFGERHVNTAWAYKNLIIDLWIQGKYAELERISAAAAESFEGARRQAGFAGLERTRFAADNSPLPILITAAAARAGKSAEAWRYLETNLARGLLDDLTACRRTDEERLREQKLARQVDQFDKQITALLNRPEVTDVARDQVQRLRRQREAAQKDLSEFEATLAKKYSAAAGEIFELPRIQARIPKDAALIAWIDFTARPKGHDPAGEHWACVIRREAAPTWVALPGGGDKGAWTSDDNQLASQLRLQCASRPGNDSGKVHDLARKLFAQRLQPLEKLLAGVRRIIILPSAQLKGIPIEVLTEEVHPERFSVSYAPSGTTFAWLQEKRNQAESARRPSSPRSILAVGDPIFGAARQPEELPPPPDHGVLISVVTPNSNAAKAGLKSGDVLLRYAQTKLNSAADLESAIGKTEAARGEGVSLQVWRDGRTRECKVSAGSLGAMLSRTPAAQAVRAQRELDRLMRHSVAANFRRLEGAGREIQSVITVFRTVKILTGSEASEQSLNKLAAGDRLAQYRYLHLATHGLLDPQSPMRSALILSQDQLPDPLQQVLAGKPIYDGRITAEQILHSWRLDAELVTLSACETGLGKYSGGEGYLGFSQALFLVGARSLVLSLWPVDDASTALLMTRFYENLLGRRPGLKESMSKGQALAEAKAWLRGLTAGEADQVGGGLIRGLDTETARGRVRSLPAKQAGSPAPVHPYAHPYYWAPFVLIGDPN